MSPSGPDARLLTTADPVTAARWLLGATFATDDVEVVVVETEAYGGPAQGRWPDPASHSWSGLTDRTRPMFGPAGALYVYRSYGIHLCANISCGPDGEAAAVLLRAAVVTGGVDVARSRRPAAASDRFLARGPGSLGRVLDADTGWSGESALSPSAPLRLVRTDAEVPIASGPRVGVSRAADRPWRFWIPHTPEVSAYRRSPRAPAAAPCGKIDR